MSIIVKVIVVVEDEKGCVSESLLPYIFGLHSFKCPFNEWLLKRKFILIKMEDWEKGFVWLLFKGHR